MGILYNKKYANGSLYGGGVFPFWLYIKFFGNPVYKLCRKRGLSKIPSLMAANIPGSCFHVSFFSSGLRDVPAFIVSLVMMALIFHFLNEGKTLKVMLVASIGLWGIIGSYELMDLLHVMPSF